jgi:hypothetical protein
MTLFATASALLLTYATSGAGAQAMRKNSPESLHIVCSLDRPVIDPSKSVTVTIYTNASGSQSLNYEWSATEGDFITPYTSSPTGWAKTVATAKAVWWPRGLEPGSYKLTATVTTPNSPGADQSCSVTIVVAHSTREAQVGPPQTARPAPATGAPRPGGGIGSGPPPAYGYATWRALLVRGQAQRPGFGLYSYMLLGGPPDEEAKERFLAFVKAYLDLIADVKGLESSQSPSALNMTYLPVDSDPPENIDADWVLKHYDYSRARQILTSVRTARGRGPFIVSALQPLDGSAVIPTPNLIEDLTAKPAGVVEFWVNQFLVQTTQQQFWQSNSLRTVALNLRTAIAYAAEGYPVVQKAISASFIFNPSR